MVFQRIARIALISAPLLALVLFWPKASGSGAGIRITSPTGGTGIDTRLMHRVEAALIGADIPARGVILDRAGVTVRLRDEEARTQAMAALGETLGAGVRVTALAMSDPR